MISKYVKDNLIITFLKPEEFSAMKDTRVQIAAVLEVFVLPLQMEEKQEKTTKSILEAI